MKKSDLKIDFTKRDVISMVCFTVVMIIVLVLGNCFGFVSASGNYDFQLNSGTNYSTYENYQNSSIYNSDAMNVFNITNNSQLPNISEIESLTSIAYDGYTHGNNTLNLSNCPNYIVYKNADVNRIHILFYGDGGVVSMMGGKTSFLFSGTSSVEWATVSVDTLNWTIASADYGVTSYGSAGLTDQNLRSYCGKNLGSYCSFLFSNSSVYAPLNSLYDQMGGSDNCFLWFKDFNEGQHVSFVDVNYQVADGEIGSSGGGGESARNNLFMNNPQWAFNQPTNCNILLDNDGKSVFTANSTSYQNEHQDEFFLHYDFEIVVKYDYDSASGGFGGAGHGFLLKTPIARSFRDPNNLLIGDTIKSRTGTFKYYDFTNSLSYWNQTFQTFYDIGCSKSFSNILTTPQIFKSCYLVNGSGSAYNDQNFYQWWTLAQSNGPIVFDGNISGSSKVKITSLIMYCNAVLVDSSGASSGNCKYYYNFLTGESGVVDNGMATNNYPYNYETSDTGYNSAYGTSAYMVQNNNNNQSVNITNNVSSDVQNEISNIITGVDDSSSSNWVSTLQTLLQANTFITFMASTFAFMPSSFWTALSTFFITCLAFLTGFVLLRVLLDLL